MQRVKGIGGVFFKAQDKQKLEAWYAQNLGVQMSQYGGSEFHWRDAEGREHVTAWAIFPHDTHYFDPSRSPMMINYLVDDLDAMLAQLKAAGAEIDPKREDQDYGRFAWVMDPEGNRIELWEPAKE